METKTTHSPGPWNVEDEGHMDHEGKLWVVDSRGLCVAELEMYHDAVIDEDEAETNAALIAAAPDLLAALKELVSLPLNTSSVESALRIIAKAEGA